MSNVYTAWIYTFEKTRNGKVVKKTKWKNRWGNFRDNVFFLKAQCLASILVGWLQVASVVCVCYLAVKYVTIKRKSSKVKILSLDINDMMFFGVTIQAID